MIYYLNYLLPLLEGASVVITTAFIVFRLPFLRQNLRYLGHNKMGVLFLLAFFSLMAIYGTHSGMIILPDNSLRSVPWSYDTGLQKNEAIVNFRDLVAVSAGLVGGPLIGFIVGAIAGFERYLLGGFTAEACGVASLVSGILAGQVQRFYRDKITATIAAITGIVAVLLQMLLILIIAQPFSNALHLVGQIIFPVLLITAGGCYLFLHIIQVIEGDRLKMQAYYNAQIEPHFLMNTLNAIRSLIRIDPAKARHYVTHLGEFMRETQRYARKECVSLSNELMQAQRYMNFQLLRFPNKIEYSIASIDKTLLDSLLPPRTLLTLLENCLTHARKPNEKLLIKVRVYADSDKKLLVIEVKDNGKGIATQRLRKIGKEPLHSEHKGGGNALYNLSQVLQHIFGNKASLNVISKAEQGSLIQLVFPSTANC